MDTQVTQVTPELIAGFAGLLLTVLASYIPGFREWYAGKSDEYKKLSMLLLLALVSVGAYSLACANVLEELFRVSVDCSRQGALQLVRAFGTAVVVNQVAYKLSPQVKSVIAAKAMAKAPYPNVDVSFGGRE